MPRYLVRLQYLGTRYAGWQVQTNGIAIQQVVGEALAPLAGSLVRPEASGRTDAGVHARAQYIHFDLDRMMEVDRLVAALNSRLPDDIRAMEAWHVADDVHARFSAVAKTYTYRIQNSRVADVFLRATHAWVPAPLDLERMVAAARPLTGEHDFRAFTVRDPEVSSTVRTLHELTLEQSDDVITMRVSANGFLRYMVRRLAGLLIEVGRGTVPVEHPALCLEPRFEEARWTAPAQGLTLEGVTYDQSVWQTPGTGGGAGFRDTMDPLQ